MEKIFENEEMTVLSYHSLDKILEKIISYTLDRFDLYRRLFNVEKLDKITIRIFDNLEEFREDAFRTRKKKSPDYSRGWFNSKDAESNLCLDLQELPSKMDNPVSCHKTISSVAHETFHYYYKKYYYGGNRITWFDEGLAQYISGEHNLYTEEALKVKFINFLDSYKPINNLNKRVNGNSDTSDDLIFKRKDVFEGYEASYFSIKYLVETKGEEYLYKLMFNNEEILKLGEHILDDMIKYYKDKYEISDNKQIVNHG